MGNKNNRLRRKKRGRRPKAVPLASNFEEHSATLKPSNSADVPSTLPSVTFSVPAVINFSIGKSPFVATSHKMAVQELSTQIAKLPVQDSTPTVKLAEQMGRKSFNSVDSDDDVIYLYSVEPKKAKLVEVVDLSDENKVRTSFNKKNSLDF